MDRVEIKAEAREIIKTNKWNIWKPLLVVALITFVVSFIAGIIAGICNADIQLTASITESIISFILLPVTVGIYAYYLNLLRGKEFSLNDLKEPCHYLSCMDKRHKLLQCLFQINTFP